ncbi:autophagy protein Apg17-domain-containing protein [Cubamyces lactineus]|nr:autophagy protein Apg17-domain-containing protein [Cubamyces lactineus]
MSNEDIRSPAAGSPSEQPHIVSLVCQAKKALQQGEQLCIDAHTLSNTSAQTVVDILALDAQVRWMSEAVLDQLKLAAQVAKSIEQKRSELESQVQEWDTLRSQRSDALDAVLESLASQYVPPDFHTTSVDSSPFGSQNGSEDEAEDDGTPFGLPKSNPDPRQSPTDTVRNRSPLAKLDEKKSKKLDRRRWKTLNDFVDERAIEDLLDAIEQDRQDLDKILGQTSCHPEDLMSAIEAIRISMPEISEPLDFGAMFKAQADTASTMAKHLESLAHHYGNMQNAMHDFEAGEEFTEDDMQGMNSDADALPGIIIELEEGVRSIEAHRNNLLETKTAAQEWVEIHRRILTDLDELGIIMTDMLEQQHAVEIESLDHLEHLHLQLRPLEELHHQYTSYQYAYNKLVLELARRRQYREAAQRVVANTMAELDAMVEEERILRAQFQAEHGQYIPEDVCLYIETPPNRWTVSTWNDEPLETLPEIENDLIEEAQQRVSGVEIGIGASQSL